MKAKTVDDYLRTADRWKPELTRLRDILRKTGMTEEIKWGMPCYTHRGKNVVGIGSFKSYFGLWFHQGALLKDDAGVLMNAQEGVTRGQRQWRMTSAKEIKVAIIKRYAKEAMALVEAGKELKADRSPRKVVVPQQLSSALRRNKGATAAFARLSPSCQREYANYIAEAKRPDTVQRRIAKILPLITAGSSLNDIYK